MTKVINFLKKLVHVFLIPFVTVYNFLFNNEADKINKL